jgi:hypothetical protein
MSNDQYQAALNWLAQNPNIQNSGSGQIQNFLQKVGAAYDDLRQQWQGGATGSIDPNAAQTGYLPGSVPNVPAGPSASSAPNGFPVGVPSTGPISSPSTLPSTMPPTTPSAFPPPVQNGCFQPSTNNFTPGTWNGWDTPGSSGLTPYQQPSWFGGGQQFNTPYDTQITGFVVRDQNSAWGAFTSQPVPVAANSFGPIPSGTPSWAPTQQNGSNGSPGFQDSITSNQPDNGRYSTTMRGVSWVSQPDRTLNTATINGCRNAAIADAQTTQWTFDSNSNVCALKYGQPVTVIKQNNLTSGTVYKLQ